MFTPIIPDYCYTISTSRKRDQRIYHIDADSTVNYDDPANVGLLMRLPVMFVELIPPYAKFKFNGRVCWNTPRRGSEGSWQAVIIKCPFCGKQHIHGGAPTAAELGKTRWSHCPKYYGNYWLVVLGEGKK